MSKQSSKQIKTYQALLTSVILAEGTTSLGEEALAFQILFTHRAIEALTVVVVAQRFYPAVTGFDWKAASEAFGGEQLVPVSFAIGTSILQEERRVGKQLAAIDAVETFRMEVLSNSFQTISFDLGVAFRARRSQVLLETVLTIQLSLFFYETKILQRTSARWCCADEVFWTPDFTKSGDERTPDVRVT